MRLAEKYGTRPATEFPMLFQRILQNAILDHFRRNKVRNLWTTLFSSFSSADDDEEYDPLETLAGEGDKADDPVVTLDRSTNHEIDRNRDTQITFASTRSLRIALLARTRRCRNREYHGMLSRQRQNSLFPRSAYIIGIATGKRSATMKKPVNKPPVNRSPLNRSVDSHATNELTPQQLAKIIQLLDDSAKGIDSKTLKGLEQSRKQAVAVMENRTLVAEAQPVVTGWRHALELSAKRQLPSLGNGAGIAGGIVSSSRFQDHP